jgi:hypothetical protein
MRERGYDARHLAGGYAAWAGEGLPLVPFSPPTRWVTRERPKIDRIADMLATIVRGADTAALDLAPQASGLLAVSLGLSRMFADDHAMLRFGMLVYDALYAWCREAAREAHGWNPAALRQAMASSAREA